MEDVGYTAQNAPIVIDASNEQVTVMNGYNFAPITPLFVPYITAYMYLNQLEELAASGDKVAAAVNPTALWQYVFSKFFHITEESAYDIAIYYINQKKAWEPTDSDLDKVPVVAQGEFVYDTDLIESAIRTGIQFALDNQDDESLWLTGAYKATEPAYAFAQQCKKAGYSSFKDYLLSFNGDYTALNYTAENADREFKALVDGFGIDRLSALMDDYIEHMDSHAWNPDTTIPGTYGYGLGSSNTTKPSISFTDVPAWCENEVAWAVSQGITSGTSTTEKIFSPDRVCTHAEIVTFLYRAAGKPAVPAGTANPFANINAGNYYYDAVLWAYANGIVDSSFDPDQECTRADTVNYIYLAKGKPSVSTGNTFTDLTEDWYIPAVNWAVNTGITGGTSTTGNTFSPERTCMRSEIVTFLYRAFA